jgi:hypothetical protein
MRPVALCLVCLLAAVGCHQRQEPVAELADVWSISGPDTVRAGTTFNVAFRAILGGHGGYVLDHADIVSTDRLFTVYIWSRDLGGNYAAVIVEQDISYTLGPVAPGLYGVRACRTNGTVIQKNITVLP